MKIREHIDYIIESGLSAGFCCAKSKFPKGCEGWRTYSERVPTKEELDKWPRAGYEGDGACIFTGFQDLEMLDLDSKNHPTPDYFRDTFLHHLKSSLDFYDKFIIESTISGGIHLYYRIFNVHASRKLAKNIDNEVIIETRGAGGLSVCAPTPGYSLMQNDWNDLSELSPDEHEELMSICRSYSMIPTEEQIDIERKDIDMSLDVTKPGDDYGARGNVLELLISHGWTFVGEKGGVVYLRRPGKDRGISATWNYLNLGRLYVFSTSTGFEEGKLIKPFHIFAVLECGGDYKKASLKLREMGFGDVKKIIMSRLATTPDVLEQRGILTKSVSLIKKLNGVEWEELKLEILTKYAKLTETKLDKIRSIKCEIADVHGVGWEVDLERNTADQKPKAKLHNLKKIISHDSEIKEAFCFNVLKQKISINRDIIGLRQKRDPLHGILLDDEIMSYLLVWLSESYHVDYSKDQLFNVLSAIANQNRFNPLTAMLDECADNWDKRERAGTWLHDFCGAEGCLYTEEVGKKWLISAVARAYVPGCKVDNTLIFESKQGAKKSSFFRALSMGFFTDSRIDIKNKDGMISLFGNWFIEFSELDGITKASAEEIKSFLSKQSDEFRLPHDRLSTKFDRMCIFCGTTNHEQYLTDVSGNRRFWSVKVGNIDIPNERTIRQLWGEVVKMYRDGQKWWYENDDPFLQIIEEQQEDREVEDSRLEVIQDWSRLNGKNGFSITELWTGAFGGKMSDRDTRSLGREFAPMLKKLNYAKTCDRVDGVPRRIWKLMTTADDMATE